MTSDEQPVGVHKGQVEVVAGAGKSESPVIFNNMPMAGSTGPVTRRASLTLANAEILAGIVIPNRMSRGTRLLWRGSLCSYDLRYTHCVTGGAETVVLWGASPRNMGSALLQDSPPTLWRCVVTQKQATSRRERRR